MRKWNILTWSVTPKTHFVCRSLHFAYSLDYEKGKVEIYRMKASVLIWMFLTSGFYCLGQVQLERQVIGSTSHTSTSGSLMITSTLGEAVVATSVSGTLIFTQGFQQPVENGNVSIKDWEIIAEYSFYPNPTSGHLTLEFSTTRPTILMVELFDLRGRKLSQPAMEIRVNGLTKTSMDLSQFADGIYQLVIRNADGELLKTVKIQKAH